MIGQSISHYRITGKLGAGGMGVVYRAADPKLSRDVALKVLPEAFASDPERMARFEREAKVLASLNHPNIASIYGFEDSGKIRALVMELVAGPTLAERIKQGAIPLDEALHIAKQIAEGLEFAHERGIIHRDLKPSNVKVTPEGAVKLLDFGLAKALEGDATEEELQNSPTLTAAATRGGILLGTAAYMSPEQARGKRVDRRADIWAFGCLLYEMLTGRRTFSGETTSDTLAAVIRAEPDWSSLPASTPPHIRELMRRCLHKDPKLRLRDIGEARIAIDQYLADPTGASEIVASGLSPAARNALRSRERWAWAMVATILLLAAIASGLSYWRLARASAPVTISEIVPPSNAPFNFTLQGGPPAISPDGRTLAFCATDATGKTMLWIRSLDSSVSQPLAGTEGGKDPFWSANSRTLGFVADDKLKTIEVSGAPSVVVADAPSFGGGSWNRDGILLFVPDYRKGLYTMSASGGAPAPLIQVVESKYSYVGSPRFLPDGKHFLHTASAVDPASSGVYFASLDLKEHRLLLRIDGTALYSSGFLLYLRDSTLMAQPFDPDRGEFKGAPHPIAERVIEDISGGVFDASENGVLVYQQGTGRAGSRRLKWFDRAGTQKKSDFTGEAGAYCDVRLSRDGSKLAFNEGDPFSQILVDELARGVGMRLTFDPDTDHGIPVWSPDGSHVLFAAVGGKAQIGIYQKPSNGAGAEELLLSSEKPDTALYPTSWSSDARFILYSRGDPISLAQGEIWLLPLVGDRKPRLFLQAPAAAYDGQFSPDVRWVAYTSRESGREEVYVVPFDASKVLNSAPGSAYAGASARWQVSVAGGHSPRWRGDGKEIFYLSPVNQIMAAGIGERGNSIEIQMIRPLFTTMVAEFFSPYDVTPDGKTFVVNTPSFQNTPLTLVTNWTAILKQK